MIAGDIQFSTGAGDAFVRASLRGADVVIEIAFRSEKVTSKKNDATGQPPLSAGPRAEYHSPVPSKKISTQVYAQSPALSALGI